MKRGLVEEPWRGVRQQVCAARRSKAKVHSRLHRPIVCPGKFDGTTPSRGNPLLCSFVHLFGFYSKDCSGGARTRRMASTVWSEMCPMASRSRFFHCVSSQRSLVSSSAPIHAKI